jgi:hypothetical protein
MKILFLLLVAKLPLISFAQSTPPRDMPNWADQVSAWSTMAATVFAALGAFLAWRSYKHSMTKQQEQLNEQQSQIDKLALIAERLDKQHQLDQEKLLRQFRPFLQIEELYLANRDLYSFRLYNNGYTASKFWIVSDSDNIELVLTSKPNFEVKHGNPFDLKFMLKDKESDLHSQSFIIRISYLDIEHNKYQQTLSYSRRHWSISKPALIDN